MSNNIVLPAKTVLKCNIIYDLGKDRLIKVISNFQNCNLKTGPNPNCYKCRAKKFMAKSQVTIQLLLSSLLQLRNLADKTIS